MTMAKGNAQKTHSVSPSDSDKFAHDRTTQLQWLQWWRQKAEDHWIWRVVFDLLIIDENVISLGG